MKIPIVANTQFSTIEAVERAQEEKEVILATEEANRALRGEKPFRTPEKVID